MKKIHYKYYNCCGTKIICKRIIVMKNMKELLW